MYVNQQYLGSECCLSCYLIQGVKLSLITVSGNEKFFSSNEAERLIRSKPTFRKSRMRLYCMISKKASVAWILGPRDRELNENSF